MSIAESQFAQYRVDTMLIGPAVLQLHFGRQRFVLLEQLVELVPFRLLRQQLLGVSELAHCRLDVNEQIVEDVLDVPIATELGKLGEVAEPRPVINLDLPFGGFVLSEEHSEDGRLPGSVVPNQADAVASFQPEEHLPQHLSAVEPLGDLTERIRLMTAVHRGEQPVVKVAAAVDRRYIPQRRR